MQQKVAKVGLVVHPTCPWFGCSPDGFVFKTNTVIEVKTMMNETDLLFDEALRSVAYLKYCEGKLEICSILVKIKCLIEFIDFYSFYSFNLCHC